jgi:L-alanine-DL-glutamate epimerase-like enolase superfamily enzyme
MKRRKFISILNSSFAISIANPILAYNSNQTDLSQHRIKEVVFDTIYLKWVRYVGKNARRDNHGNGTKVSICKIFTDQGAMGWGMTRGSQLEQTTAMDFLKNKTISEVFDPRIGILFDVLLPLDIALHDLAGIVLNKPVYTLMGQKKPILTKAYSGMIYFDELENNNNLQILLDECKADYVLGYRQFKLKIGRGNMWMPKEEGIKQDIEVTKLIAKNFPDCELLVDANDGYNVEDFCRYLSEIQPIKLFWVEEPFAETEADYRILNDFLEKNKIKTLLAEGEFKPNQEQLMDLARKKLIDVHISDIVSYGFTPWRKLMPELKKLNILASPHAFGHQLKTFYIAHLAGALGNTVTIEGIPSTSEDVDFGENRLKNGQFIPSNEAGFGMKLLKK